PCAMTVMASAMPNTTVMSCSIMMMSTVRDISLILATARSGCARLMQHDSSDLGSRALSLRRAHAAGRLVEQEQLRVGDQGHADLEQRHIAVGQSPRLPTRKRRQPDLLESLLDALTRDRITLRVAERMQKALRSLERYPEIFCHGQLGENALHLQRPLDPQPADLMCG